MAEPSCFIGIDVGGTKIAAGLVELPSGRMAQITSVPTASVDGGPAVLAKTKALAGRLRDKANRSGRVVTGIGLSICELVDLDGNIMSDHSVKWLGLGVQADLSEVAPTVIESDVRAHAVAEATWGAAQAFETFLFVSVGTGISSCLMLNGEPHRGTRGNAIVLATSATETCPSCGQHAFPSLEETSSGPALAALYNGLSGGGDVRSAIDVIDAALNGDSRARDVLTRGGAALGRRLGLMVDVLDPGAIVVGGGLGSAGGAFWLSLVDACRRSIWAESSRALPIVQAKLGSEAAIAGIALLAARHLHGDGFSVQGIRVGCE